MSGHTADTAHRFFFALRPPSEMAHAMAWRAERLNLDGRREPETRLHLTLAFHGRCDPEQRARLETMAANIHLPRFDLVLDRVGAFRRGGVVWLGPSWVPMTLSALARLLAPADDRNVDGRRFRPHVTLARRSTPVQASRTPSLRWPIAEFALIESGRKDVTGGYRECARWPLAAASV